MGKMTFTDNDITICSGNTSILKLKKALKLKYKFSFHIHKWIVYNFKNFTRLKRVCSVCGKQQISDHVLPGHHTIFITPNNKN